MAWYAMQAGLTPPRAHARGDLAQNVKKPCPYADRTTRTGQQDGQVNEEVWDKCNAQIVVIR